MFSIIQSRLVGCKCVCFLDTLVIRTDGNIMFDLYSKPTDRHCYLHYTSNHLDKLKISGPYSQFLRLKRISTRPADFDPPKRPIHAIEYQQYSPIIGASRPYQERYILKVNNQDLFRPLPLLANKVGPKISNQLIRAEFSSTHSGKIGKTFLNPVEDCKKSKLPILPQNE